MGWPEFPEQADRLLDKADALKDRLKYEGKWPSAAKLLDRFVPEGYEDPKRGFIYGKPTDIRGHITANPIQDWNHSKWYDHVIGDTDIQEGNVVTYILTNYPEGVGARDYHLSECVMLIV